MDMKRKTHLMTIPQEVNMKFNQSNHAPIYQIKIKEKLDTAVVEWFGGLTLTPIEDGGTLLTGPFPDQSALRGFLEQLWNLNLTVLSVDQIK
jgi:hypothetical protein